jgi:hypothetical protein
VKQLFARAVGIAAVIGLSFRLLVIRSGEIAGVSLDRAVLQDLNGASLLALKAASAPLQVVVNWQAELKQ